MFTYKSKKFHIKTVKTKSPNGKYAISEVLLKGSTGVGILPVSNDGHVVLAYHHRPAVKKRIYSLPGGKIKMGESPKAAARRELLEELGYKANSIVPLAKLYTTPYFSNDAPHMFLASGIKYAGSRPDADENIEPRKFTIAKAMKMVDSGAIEDMSTVTALLLLWKRMHKGGVKNGKRSR